MSHATKRVVPSVDAAHHTVHLARPQLTSPTNITSMGASSDKLKQLRPVSFHLNSDPDGAVRYGLIAEEVNKVYPELVIRDAAGKIQGVRYDELAPLLVNEAQKQQRINESQAAEIRDL